MLRVGVQVLRIGRLHGVDRERRLPGHEGEPVSRAVHDVGDRLTDPVVRDLRQGQLPALRALGLLDGVPHLEPWVAPPFPQRAVVAVRPGIVADVEVDAQLQLPARQDRAADRRVPDRHGRQRQGDTRQQERPRRRPATDGPAVLQRDPDQDRNQQDDGVLPRQVERPQRHPGREQHHRAPRQRRFHQEPERERPEEQVEDRVLEDGVVEDGGTVQGQQHARRDGDRAGEQPPGRLGDQDAREGADPGLDDPDRQGLAPEQGIHDAQEIGVERRVEEDLAPEPVPRRGGQAQLVVVGRVAHPQREEGRVGDAPDMEQPDHQGEDEDGPTDQQPVSRRPTVSGHGGMQEFGCGWARPQASRLPGAPAIAWAPISPSSRGGTTRRPGRPGRSTAARPRR